MNCTLVGTGTGRIRYLSSVLAGNALLAEVYLVLAEALEEILLRLDLLVDELGVAGAHLLHQSCNRVEERLGGGCI